MVFLEKIRDSNSLGLRLFGKSWKKVEKHIGSRTGAQIRSHAQKFFIRIKKQFPNEEPMGVLARHNFEGDIAYIGMDEEDSLPPRAKEFKSEIDKDLDEMRQRLEAKVTPPSTHSDEQLMEDTEA